MTEEIIADMKANFKKGVFTERKTFLFSMDEIQITVVVDADSFVAEEGKTVEKADCFCKTGKEMFKKIWFDGYRPGIMDFLGGAIKADQPLLLQQFVKAFGR